MGSGVRKNSAVQRGDQESFRLDQMASRIQTRERMAKVRS